MANPLNYAAEPKMVTPVKQTAFSEAAETFQQVDKLRRRIDDLVTRLVGFAPEQSGSASEMPDPVGVFDSLSRGARDASEDIARMHAALDRLDRAI